jgi:iron complex outermembrane receptor protein
MHALALTTGASYTVHPGWTLRMAAGRKSRFPTLRERFGAALGTFVPNPSLQPVTAWIGEVGTDVTTGSLRASATAFLNRTVDTIDKRTLAAGREQRINLEGSRTHGIETSARWTATRGLTLDGHLTWSRPRGLTDDGTERLDEKPAWVGTGTATYTLPVGLSLMVQARYTGGTYARTDANTFTALPDALLWDVRASLAFDRWLPALRGGSVFARVDNLTDEAQFLQLGLPGPGRRLRAGMTVTL